MSFVICYVLLSEFYNVLLTVPMSEINIFRFDIFHVILLTNHPGKILIVPRVTIPSEIALHAL